jgi:hypothetical protein
MLNLNVRYVFCDDVQELKTLVKPAMRPSAAQLLQHERLELVFKVSETEKMSGLPLNYVFPILMLSAGSQP